MTDDLKFGKERHWNFFQSEGSTMAVTFFNDKTVLVNVSNDSQTVQIIGPGEEALVIRLENDEVVEQYYKKGEKVDKISTDLRVYRALLHTLPQSMKDALAGLM